MPWNRAKKGTNADAPELVKTRAREVNSLHGTILTSVDKRVKWLSEEDADQFHKEYTGQLEEKAPEGLQEEINGRLA